MTQLRWQAIANELVFHEQESKALRKEWQQLKALCNHPHLPSRVGVAEYYDTCPDCGHVSYCVEVIMTLLPKRDIQALIEALRIRALAMTGAAWERDASSNMMKEAAQQLEDITTMFKPDVAYMPVPRCETCVHWGQPIRMKGGVCVVLSKMLDSFGQVVVTPEDFGCVQWEPR